MKLEDLLKRDVPSKKFELTRGDLESFFYKFKGLEKELEREEAFWNSTNKNLEKAYVRLREEAERRERAEKNSRKETGKWKR